MGLDMYLIPKYEEESLYDAKEKFNEIAYWRKAYSLDQWFTAHGSPIKDKDIYRDVTWEPDKFGPSHWLIKRDQLKDLLKDLINAMDDEEHPLNDETEYLNIPNTVNQVINALDQCKAKHFIYYASW